MTAAVVLKDIALSRDPRGLPALDGVSLTVSEGEAVALIGPSGAGKTTLMTLIDGRLRGWSGRADVFGTALAPERSPPREHQPDTGFIFQEFALVERSTVLRNVLNGRLGRMSAFRAILGQPTKGDLVVARRALADCGIAALADRRVDSLSGGQRQRVAIARCLAQEPRLVLADEPVSNLDPARAVEILTLLTGAAQARGAATIFSSHQPDLARRFADRIVGLREGRVIFDTPATALAEVVVADLYHDTASDVPPRLQAVR